MQANEKLKTHPTAAAQFTSLSFTESIMSLCQNNPDRMSQMLEELYDEDPIAIEKYMDELPPTKDVFSMLANMILKGQLK